MADRYWVGGTGTWNTTSTTNWSATSGGASGASVPTVADSVFFDQASTYTVTMTGALACLNFNVTGGTVTFQNGTSPTLDVRGSWSTVAATVWNTTGAITFSATTSRTITTNAITIRSPITFNGVGGTWTLQDNLTLLSTLTTTLSAGTLALNNFTLSTGIFTSTTTTTRVITFGTTGQITITGNAATVLSMATLTGFTYTGTARIYSSYSGATGTRTFLLGSSVGAVPTNVFNVSFDTSGTGLVIAPATDTVSLQGVYFNADFTNLTNTVSNDTRFFYGNLTVPASGGTFTAGANVTHIVAGIAVDINVQRTLDFPFSVNSVGGTLNFLNNFTIGSTRTFTLTAGTLALSTFTLTTGLFNSSGSTARTINFGTGKIVLNSATTSTIWTTGTTTNLTISGTPLVECIGGGTAVTKTINTGAPSEANSISFSLLDTGGTPTYAFSASNVIRNLIVNGAQTVSNINLIIYGTFTHTTVNGTTTFTAGANAWTFAATSGSYTVTNIAGFTYDFPWTFGSAASTATWTIAANLTLGATRQLSLTNGTFDFNNKTFSGAGVTIVTGTPTIANTGGPGSLSLTVPITHTSGSLTLPFNLTTTSASGYTLTAGTLTLNNFTLTAPAFSSSGSTARTLAFGTGQLALTGNAATIFDITTATNFSTTGTVYINSTYTGSTGTRTFVTGFTAAQAASYIVSTSGTDGIVLSPSATDIVALTGNYNNIDFTGFTGTLSNTARTIYGNLTMPASGGTFTAGALVTTFAATSGTKTITTNSRTLDFPVTINGTGGTFQLQDALTLGSTRAFTLTAGTLNLNDFTLSAVTFSSNNSNTRSVAFGTTGKITLGGNNATIVDLSTMTNFTYTGTPKIYSTYTGATGTRTFNIGNAPSAGATSTNVFDLSIGTSGNGLVIAAGTDTLVLIGSFNDFNLTGLAQTINNNSRFIYGNFTLPASGGTLAAGVNILSFLATSGTKTITTNGRTLDFPVTISGTGGTFQLLSNFTLGSTRAFTLTAGTLNLNDFTLSLATFSSSGTGVRSVAFGTTGLISLGGNNATIVDLTDITNFTYTGTPKIYSTYTGATGTRTFNFGGTGAIGVTSTNIFDLSIGTSGNGLVIAAGTDSLTLAGGFNNFDLTGMTHTLVSNTRFIYGDFTIPASGGTLSSGTAINSFVGVSGTKNITTNGRTLDFPITLNGAATFRLQSALLQGSTRAFTHTNGTIDLNGYTLTVGTTYTTATGTKNLTFNGGSLVCPANTATAFNNAVPGGFTTTAGTGTGVISLTAATAKTFVGNNAIYNCDIDQSGAGALTITGLNTFNRIKSSYANTTANASILLPIETIVTGIVGGSASNKMLDLGSATAIATVAPFRASVVISNSSIQTASYVQANSIIFNASELQNPSSQTSVLFDGSGDYLTIADNAALQMGSGDFTIEFWWYPNSIAGYQTPYDKGYSGSGGLVLQTGLGTGRIIVVASGSSVVTSNTALIPGSWTHMALVRNSTSLTLYQNGISVGSATNSTNFSNTSITGIGGNASGASAGQYPINGYISNLRSVKGTAVYTSAFTPPAAPLTAIANTSLLTCQSATFVDNGPNNFTVTAVGDSIVSSFFPFDDFSDGTTPWRLYLANSINNGDTLGAVFQEYSNSAPIVYYITRGTSFTVPANWNNSNNAVHIYGAGGGSSGSYVPNSSGNRLGSAGGGGGGYTQVLNLTATPGNSLSYNIGSAGAAGSANTIGSGGNGGNTTFAGIYTANGGGGSSITSSTTTAGTGGTGATANGGIAGLGGGAASQTNNSSGGGGGGSGGPNGAGANGGTGVVAADPSTTPGGGGGGSGGGTNGTNAVATIPGTGGNSFIGVRVGGTGGLANTFAGVIGRERGRASYDILGSIGGSGGGGGGGANGPSIRDGLNIGGGAGGSGATDSDFANQGTAGQSGGIIIVYYPSAVVSGNFSNMFLVF